jgi:hypothetical protein
MKVLGVEEVRWAVQDAAERWSPDGRWRAEDEPVIRLLATQWVRGAPVPEVAGELLADALGAAVMRGWSRAEIVLKAGRAGRTALELVDTFLTDGPDACAGCWAERARVPVLPACAAMVAALGMLSRIPPRPPPRDTPPPRTRATIEPKVLARVRALLAKAESTTFPDEAEALRA